MDEKGEGIEEKMYFLDRKQDGDHQREWRVEGGRRGAVSGDGKRPDMGW